jgi:hypothetical protein
VDDRNRPGKLQQALAIASTLLMAWMMLPEHQRTLALMRVTDWARRRAGSLARSEGRAGMADELAGRPDLAASRYGGAFLLASLRDGLAGLLERMRP